MMALARPKQSDGIGTPYDLLGVSFSATKRTAIYLTVSPVTFPALIGCSWNYSLEKSNNLKGKFH